MDIAVSKAGVPIRLTDERWYHIVENHDDLAGYYDDVLITVEEPDYILRGYGGALVAVRSLGRRKFLAVIYKEVTRNDGFIITAYFANSVFCDSDFTKSNPMAKRIAVAKALEELSEAVPHLIRLPEGRAWIDYDQEADVLYISLKRPQKATDTKFLSDKGILLRYRAKDLVGVTVLNASKPRKRAKARH